MKHGKNHISVKLEIVELDGDLDVAIATLQLYKSKHSEYELLYLDGMMERSPYDDSDHYELVLKGTRLETDSEYDARLAKDADRKARRTASDRAEYEQLKKQFEPESKTK